MKRRAFIKIAGASVVAASVTAIQTAALTQSEPTRSVRLSKAIPFKINVPQATLNKIEQRVRSYGWYETPTVGGHEYGLDMAYLKELTAYWVNDYDWRKHEREMNRFNHFKALIEGEQLHFIYEKGSGRNPQPLLLLHGWPYSFYDLLGLTLALAHPERKGGNAEDGFDVIVASLPGYGFSDKPKNPIGVREIGKRMNRLMTEVLGYRSYIVHAGDWGGVIASVMGIDYAGHIKGIHITNPEMLPQSVQKATEEGSLSTVTFLTEEERAYLRDKQKRFNSPDFAYWKLQASRPETLGYGMMDSPVGAAAWIVEKFYLWSDQRSRPFERIFTKDQLLTEVMIYLVTRTFNTASWSYAGFVRQDSFTLPDGQKIEVPTGVAAFAEPLAVPPPRILAERSYNIVQWTNMPSGGHFPALEQPRPLIEEIRKFGRLVR